MAEAEPELSARVPCVKSVPAAPLERCRKRSHRITGVRDATIKTRPFRNCEHDGRDPRIGRKPKTDVILLRIVRCVSQARLPLTGFQGQNTRHRPATLEGRSRSMIHRKNTDAALASNQEAFLPGQGRGFIQPIRPANARPTCRRLPSRRLPVNHRIRREWFPPLLRSPGWRKRLPRRSREANSSCVPPQTQTPTNASVSALFGAFSPFGSHPRATCRQSPVRGMFASRIGPPINAACFLVCSRTPKWSIQCF